MGTSDERPDDGGDALSAPGGVPDDVDGCHYAALVGEADLDDDLGNDYDPAEYELTGAELGELDGLTAANRAPRTSHARLAARAGSYCRWRARSTRLDLSFPTMCGSGGRAHRRAPPFYS